MTIGKIHTVGILEPGNDPGSVLDFEIGLHYLDVVELALVRRPEIEAPFVQGEESIMGLDKLMDGG